MKKLGLVLVLAMALVSTPATAITIDLYNVGGTPFVNSVGGGNLSSIMRTAADMWQSATSEYTGNLAIDYGYANIESFAAHWNMGQADGHETRGKILFNTGFSFAAYMDPYPNDNSEYQTYRERSANLGPGGPVNDGRVWGNIADKLLVYVNNVFDVLSVALHELGHALGLSPSLTAFRESASDGWVTVADEWIPMEFGNNGLPTGHIKYDSGSVWAAMGGVTGNERHLLSDIDILAVESFWMVDTAPGSRGIGIDPLPFYMPTTDAPQAVVSVPEPAPWILLLTGLIILGGAVESKQFKKEK